MKLYTKEMFLIAAEECEVCMIDAEHIMKHIDEYVTPIEIPIDEEIVQASEATYREHPSNLKDHPEWKYNQDINAPRKRKAFINGANWVIEQIKQQGKSFAKGSE